MTRSPHRAIRPEANEFDSLQRIERLVAAGNASLVSPSGEAEPLPASLRRVLDEALAALAEGCPVQVIPRVAELSTQEAADLLNVSRPFLARLLRGNELPSHMVGSHRRVRLEDVLEFRARRSVLRRQILDDLARDAQSSGMLRS